MNSSAKGLFAGEFRRLAARLGPAVAHVVEDAGGENHRVLRHHRDQAPQRGGIELPQVGVADADAALLRIVKAQQQREHRGLARARRTHQSHALSLRQPQREAIERRRAGPRGVSEGDGIECDFGVHRPRGAGSAGAEIDGCVSRISISRSVAPARALQFAPDFRNRPRPGRHHEGVRTRTRTVRPR
jgi:hypothetical protein